MNKTISGILKRLRPRFQRPSPLPSQLLGLSAEEMRQVHRLTQMPGWKAYHKALEHLFHLEAEHYFQGLSHDDYLTKSGLLAGLRRGAVLDRQALLLRFVNTSFWRGDRAERMARADGRPTPLGPGEDGQ